MTMGHSGKWNALHTLYRRPFKMPNYFFSIFSLISNEYSSNNRRISWRKKNLNKKIGRALCWAMFIEQY